MVCSLPGSSVHGIFQARVLEWVAIARSQLIQHTHWLLKHDTGAGYNSLKAKSIQHGNSNGLAGYICFFTPVERGRGAGGSVCVCVCVIPPPSAQYNRIDTWVEFRCRRCSLYLVCVLMACTATTRHCALCWGESKPRLPTFLGPTASWDNRIINIC